MALFVIAGIVISAWLGVLGLIRGQLDLTYQTTLTGKSAKAASILCLLFSVLLTLMCIWIIAGAPRLQH